MRTQSAISAESEASGSPAKRWYTSSHSHLTCLT